MRITARSLGRSPLRLSVGSSIACALLLATGSPAGATPGRGGAPRAIARVAGKVRALVLPRPATAPHAPSWGAAPRPARRVTLSLGQRTTVTKASGSGSTPLASASNGAERGLRGRAGALGQRVASTARRTGSRLATRAFVGTLRAMRPEPVEAPRPATPIARVQARFRGAAGGAARTLGEFLVARRKAELHVAGASGSPGVVHMNLRPGKGGGFVATWGDARPARVTATALR